MIVLFLFLIIAALGVAATLGLTADTRDPAFGMGRLAAHHPRR